ncbi:MULTISPECIES: hypothetical protein [unclassified Streptomyces]
MDDVVHGEPDDAAQRLCVEENDDVGDAESQQVKVPAGAWAEY